MSEAHGLACGRDPGETQHDGQDGVRQLLQGSPLPGPQVDYLQNGTPAQCTLWGYVEH
jgi:hypothetical protein